MGEGQGEGKGVGIILGGREHTGTFSPKAFKGGDLQPR